jgi:hypothetical protein
MSQRTETLLRGLNQRRNKREIGRVRSKGSLDCIEESSSQSRRGCAERTQFRKAAVASAGAHVKTKDSDQIRDVCVELPPGKHVEERCQMTNERRKRPHATMSS